MPRANSSAQILRNKRVNQRVRSLASTADLTPDLSISDHYHITSLASALTIKKPIGNPRDGDKLAIRIRDNGVSRTITWNTAFRGGSLPTSTGLKLQFIECRFNAPEGKWEAVTIYSA